jgi:hypothetical protein
MPLLRRVVLVVLVTSALDAHAWEAFFASSSEVSLRGSSMTSTEASRDDEYEQRERGDAPEGTACSRHEQCRGFCDAGRCVDRRAPVSAPQTTPSCQSDQQCTPGSQCVDAQCVPLASPPPALPIPKCESDQQCAPGYSCISGQCASVPPPPGASLLRRGSEVYVRERAVQLRQDLALGDGPTIAVLAKVQSVAPATLGKLLRAHRTELVALMGDGKDPAWPARFLDRVEALQREVALACR